MLLDGKPSKKLFASVCVLFGNPTRSQLAKAHLKKLKAKFGSNIDEQEIADHKDEDTGPVSLICQ